MLLLGAVALAASSCTDPMPTFVFPADGAVDGETTDAAKDAGGDSDAGATDAQGNSDAGLGS